MASTARDRSMLDIRAVTNIFWTEGINSTQIHFDRFEKYVENVM